MADSSGSINWAGAMQSHQVIKCSDPDGGADPKYSERRGGLLRLAVKDVASVNPLCFRLGTSNFKFDLLTGVSFDTLTPSLPLHYRGAEQYPSWRDPTDPAKGGSGYNGFTSWAFKRGGGQLHGTCSVGFPAVTCGHEDWVSEGNGELLQAGEIIGGFIVDFPPNDSFFELVNFTGATTGCCRDHYVPPPNPLGVLISTVEYYFCVYPEGQGPSNNPGP